jgi:pyruvate kinase
LRRTRIVATLGPASDTPDTIRALLEAGTDIFRLNFSHGSRDTHAESCARIRAMATSMGRTIAVMQDLAGPKIRIGDLDRPLDLVPGNTLAIDRQDRERRPPASGGARVTTGFRALFESVRPGARLLLDDGRIELEVTSAGPETLETRVVNGGRLESRKGINVPGSDLVTPAVTDKDAADLRAGIAMGVDAVAVSFVQDAEDMRRARAAATAAGAPDLPLIAKIEKPQAVNRIEAILGESDGLMVARGDLGIEIPLESVPAVQKRLVLAARDRGVPVIVATQVLESMRTEPRPTRAEVTDAAHAVDEGADAVLLAGETAIGRYPVLAVETLSRILQEAEREPARLSSLSPDRAGWLPHSRALCEAAVTLATRAGAAAIVAVTDGGRTARLLSALRPRARIIAAAPTPEVAARLNLFWGVTSVVAPASPPELRRMLLEQALVSSGAVIVVVSIGPDLGRQDANFVHVETL